MKNLYLLTLLLPLIISCSIPQEMELTGGSGWTSRREYSDFVLSGQARTSEGAAAAVRFCIDGEGRGYEVLLHNGPIDGSLKTGSLTHVRNLYRSLASDGEWFDFDISVRGRNIGVRINGVDVVCYTEPDEPWRSDEHEGQRIATGRVALEINPRYRIPSLDIIRRAKERGIKFTFGTNNVDADFGRLEYALEAIEACGITPDDIWFPSMSIRSTRSTVIYNHFD